MSADIVRDVEDLRAKAQSCLPRIDGELHVPGLKERVSVVRDVHGVLHRPADTSRGPFPLLLANHGGWTAVFFVRVRPPDAREVPLPPRRSFRQWCSDLARAGYVMLVSGYRGEVTPLGQSDGHIEFGFPR